MHFHVYIIESSVGEREREREGQKRLGYWVCEPIENNIIGMIYQGVYKCIIWHVLIVVHIVVEKYEICVVNWRT